MVEQLQPGSSVLVASKTAMETTAPTIRVSCDALCRQIAIRDANGTAWDANGNLVSEYHADGGVVAYSAQCRSTILAHASPASRLIVFPERHPSRSRAHHL